MQPKPPNDEMDGRGSGHKSRTLERRTFQRSRSASPHRDRGCRPWQPVCPLQWGYNTMANVISHWASECIVCKDYVLHISEVPMDNNESYPDTVDRQESNWVPIHEHERAIRQNSRLSHNLDNCQDEISALRESIRDLEATPNQPTFAAVAAASGDKPLTRRDLPAPPAPSSVSKKPVPAKQQV